MASYGIGFCGNGRGGCLSVQVVERKGFLIIGCMLSAMRSYRSYQVSLVKMLR
jgi:hypothetical protein